jgi:prepilin-type N-terminal cleavage/methylation domain-containing protein
MQTAPMFAINSAAFTLVELLVSLALLAVIVPVIYQGLRIATLAGEVSQRKALAARIGERVLNEAIVNGQTQSATSGNESAGPYQFRWTLKDEPWNQLGNLQFSSYPNAVNQGVVSQSILHQLSVDVTYTAQGKDYSVHLSTLANISQQ